MPSVNVPLGRHRRLDEAARPNAAPSGRKEGNNNLSPHFKGSEFGATTGQRYHHRRPARDGRSCAASSSSPCEPSSASAYVLSAATGTSCTTPASAAPATSQHIYEDNFESGGR